MDVVISEAAEPLLRIDVILSPPKFAFRETLRKKVKVQGKHKETIRRTRTVWRCHYGV
ncbi:MAG: hypothetical protein ACLR0U_03315 [Enterocloster clostridioformis]